MKRKVIALCGGIGSGKSTVGAILRGCGFTILNCDEISRDVANNPEVIQQVQALLGSDSLKNGQLARKVIREKIFADKELYNSYCALFWSRIKSHLMSELEKTRGTVFVEIAVLDAFDFRWDEIWVVESSVQSRVNRVIRRDGVSESNIADIISKQKDVENYTRKISNNGSLEDLKNDVIAALKQSKLI